MLKKEKKNASRMDGLIYANKILDVIRFQNYFLLDYFSFQLTKVIFEMVNCLYSFRKKFALFPN